IYDGDLGPALLSYDGDPIPALQRYDGNPGPALLNHDAGLLDQSPARQNLCPKWTAVYTPAGANCILKAHRLTLKRGSALLLACTPMSPKDSASE
ncbi:MAG: uncharacterized protein KVP18_000138, partial [Porospora cf. gigantea A]|uniref:uncharacterized protein n=1 Tax=Porospora cf. gigantea A TaxID=2853593 RepID=UPI00355A8431